MRVPSPCLFLTLCCYNFVAGVICRCKFRVNSIFYKFLKQRNRPVEVVFVLILRHSCFPAFFPPPNAFAERSRRSQLKQIWQWGLSSSQWGGSCPFVVYWWCWWSTEDRKLRNIHLSNLGCVHHDGALQNSDIIPGDEFGPLIFPGWLLVRM